MTNHGDGRRHDVRREELYAQVWSEPMVRLAKRYGVSDVALAKVCRKLDIPGPPRGYWRRLETGWRPTPPPPPQGPPGVGGVNPPTPPPGPAHPRPTKRRDSRPRSLRNPSPETHL